MSAEELNPQQRLALEHLTGPVLILAGAGSGKTRVLTYRIAELVAKGLCQPQEIWATTFTNKAAAEMRERASNLLRSKGLSTGRNPFVSTFHSSGADILRRYGSVMGLSPTFTIYDDGDQLALIKRVMKELNISDKQWNPKMFRHQIGQLKNKGQDPLTFSRQASTFDKEMIYRVYELYQKRMKDAQALDFGDLLMEAVRLIKDYPQVREVLQAQYKFFHVDEFQDTNPIQYEWIRILAGASNNLCVVGDEDQSIYGWRGANIWNILDFKKDYPDAVQIKLERNYRSTQTIVTAASHVIAHNSERMDKTLYSEEEKGSKIRVFPASNEYHEADLVLNCIQEFGRQGTAYSEMAIFYRTNAQSRVLEDRLRAHRIPYQVYGGLKFYDRAEIKDALAYLRLTVNPMDDVAFQRVVNVPARGVGKGSIEKLLLQKTTTSKSLLEISEMEGILSGKARNGIVEFLELISEMTHLVQTKQSPFDVFQHWWNNSGYIEMLSEEDTPEADSRRENLGELENALREYGTRVTSPTVQGFLEEIALFTDRPQDRALAHTEERGVNLMTLHSSKGLEFEVVFMTGLEEGLFPSTQSFDDPHGVEEERRLFYVGMTRARFHLQILYAANRMAYGVTQPKMASRFLRELPTPLVSVIGTPGRHIERPATRDYDDDTDPQHDDVPEIQSRDFDGGGFSAKYRKGQRVRHQEYGIGVIRTCDGSQEDERVVVQFMNPGVGLKKFMAKYAQLEVVR